MFVVSILITEITLKTLFLVVDLNHHNANPATANIPPTTHCQKVGTIKSLQSHMSVGRPIIKIVNPRK